MPVGIQIAVLFANNGFILRQVTICTMPLQQQVPTVIYTRMAAVSAVSPVRRQVEEVGRKAAAAVMVAATFWHLEICRGGEAAAAP